MPADPLMHDPSGKQQPPTSPQLTAVHAMPSPANWLLPRSWHALLVRVWQIVDPLYEQQAPSVATQVLASHVELSPK